MTCPVLVDRFCPHVNTVGLSASKRACCRSALSLLIGIGASAAATSLVNAGSFDYAGDGWGFTYGAAAEWYQDR